MIKPFIFTFLYEGLFFLINFYGDSIQSKWLITFSIQFHVM